MRRGLVFILLLGSLTAAAPVVRFSVKAPGPITLQARSAGLKPALVKIQ
jgi:hypothetical protein